MASASQGLWRGCRCCVSTTNRSTSVVDLHDIVGVRGHVRLGNGTEPVASGLRALAGGGQFLRVKRAEPGADRVPTERPKASRPNPGGSGDRPRQGAGSQLPAPLPWSKRRRQPAPYRACGPQRSPLCPSSADPARDCPLDRLESVHKPRTRPMASGPLNERNRHLRIRS